jgi:hypothetical protein
MMFLFEVQRGRAVIAAAASRRLQSPRGIEENGRKTALLRLTNAPHQTLTEVRRSEFAITDTDDSAIAAAAIIGDKRSPVIG